MQERRGVPARVPRPALRPDSLRPVAVTEPWDLREAQDALAYWQARRRRLAWHRRAERREADHMVATWEEAVRHAVLRFPGASSGDRARAVVLVVRSRFDGARRRWRRRLLTAGAATAVLGGAGFAAVDALLRGVL